MMSLFLIILASATGVMTKSNCKETPKCCRKPFSKESIEAHYRSGNFIPSEKFIGENCKQELLKTWKSTFTASLKCVQSYFEECPVKEQGPDINIAIDCAKEICDIGSKIRKGYAAHVDCFNSMNFTSQGCFISGMDILRRLKFPEMIERNIDPHCMYKHVFESCALSCTEKVCGGEAKEVAVEIMNRLSNMFKCDQVDEKEYENLKKKGSD